MGQKNRHGLKKSRVKTVFIFDWQCIIHTQFVPVGETINAVYNRVMEKFLNRIRHVRQGTCESCD